MQKEGTVKFLKYHDRAVKGVSFNPAERYIFCSCSSDGRINIYGSYNSSFHYLLVSYPLLGREVNAVKFSVDGRRILCALSTKKLAVLDVETGSVINAYDMCCSDYVNRETFVRTPIATTDKMSPYLAITPFNGRGVSILDIRAPISFDVIYDVQSTEIRDIIFLDNSWPFVTKQGIATLTSNGFCRIISLDKRPLHTFNVGHKTTTLTATPEPFNLLADSGFRSEIVFGGDSMSFYRPETVSVEKIVTSSTDLTTDSEHAATNNLTSEIPDHHSQLNFSLTNSRTAANTFSSIHHHSIHFPFDHPRHHSALERLNHHNSINPVAALIAQHFRRISSFINTKPIENRISQLKYGSNGGLLYATTNSNQKYTVQRFRRYANGHRLIGELYSHKSEIFDMDISSTDNMIVTASRDKTVGVMCLGSPNHGTTSTSELT